MITLKELKKKYQELPRREKEIIGESLVKVNLGVGQPADFKRVAAFVKGSDLIAKAGNLDKLMEFFGNEKEEDNKRKSRTGTITHYENPNLTPSQIDTLKPYDEDEAETEDEIQEALRKG